MSSFRPLFRMYARIICMLEDQLELHGDRAVARVAVVVAADRRGLNFGVIARVLRERVEIARDDRDAPALEPGRPQPAQRSGEAVPDQELVDLCVRRVLEQVVVTELVA